MKIEVSTKVMTDRLAGARGRDVDGIKKAQGRMCRITMRIKHLLSLHVGLLSFPGTMSCLSHDFIFMKEGLGKGRFDSSVLKLKKDTPLGWFEQRSFAPGTLQEFWKLPLTRWCECLQVTL